MTKRIIYKDAELEEIGLKLVDADTGDPIDGSAFIVISREDLEELGLENTEMRVRLFRFKDAAGCDPKKMAIICTEPEDDV